MRLQADRRSAVAARFTTCRVSPLKDLAAAHPIVRAQAQPGSEALLRLSAAHVDSGFGKNSLHAVHVLTIDPGQINSSDPAIRSNCSRRLNLDSVLSRGSFGHGRLRQSYLLRSGRHLPFAQQHSPDTV
jgi:hypothetical protein